MSKNLGTIGLMLVLASFLIVGCGPTKKGEEPEETSAKKTYTPTGNEATVMGVVKFEGTPPAPKKIDMGNDANCASAPGDKTTDDVVVTDGKLANVFVYVKGPKVDEFSFPTQSEAVVLDQLGCRYHPRVLGLRTGQLLSVKNSDPTTHNVHPTPAKNVEWNQSQTPGQGPIEKKFTKPETLIPVKCNQHPWMKAHIGVLDHPFFNVSAKDGSYKITGLPPGDYTIVAWHEMGGDKGTEKTAKFTVAAKESKTQEFAFGSAMASAPPSHLKVEPALVLP